MTTLRAALWLFRDVTLPSWLHHRLRTVLTLVGVAVGVQVVVAVSLINRSTMVSFEQTAETIAGGADLQIANGTVGVPEALIAQVAGLGGVASAAGLIQGTLRTDWGLLTLFGADLLGDQRIRQTQFPRENVRIRDELRFLNSPDSVALSTSFADRAGLGLGSSLEAVGPAGRTTLTVRGFLDPVGPAALFGGAVALADLPTAQRLLALGDRVDQIDIKLADSAEPEQVQAQVIAIVDGAGGVEPPRERGARLGTMLNAVQTVLTLVGLFAIIVGAFIIYHTMQTAIVQRRRDLALARAVGYGQDAVLTAIVLEALAFGAIGAAVGILLADLGARASLNVVTSGIGAIWARIERPDLRLTLREFGLACTLGIGMSLVAAVSPAREILRMRIVEQLRSTPGEGQPGRRPWSLGFGIAVAVAGFALFYADLRPQSFGARITYIMASIMLVAFGYVVVTPIVEGRVLRALAFLARRLPGLGLALATENLARDARRSQSATAALMVAFAMVLIVSAFVSSLRGSMMTWLDQTLAADLWVAPGPQLALPSSPTLPGDLENVLRGVPGVAEVSASRTINVRVGDGLAVLRTESFGGLQRQAYPIVESDGQDWLARFGTGSAVLVSDNFAYRFGLHAGDSLAFDTPSGRSRFEIGAVVIDYTLDIGTVIVERETYKRVWRDDLVNSFFVWLEGADPSVVRTEISERVAPELPVTIFTGAEIKKTIGKALDDALVMTYAIQLLAMVIALIGVLNFFLAEVEDRRREIGLLRGVALDKGHVLRMLSLEAVILGAFGGLAAVLYAWPVSMMLVTRSTRLVSGWRLTFTFPHALAFATIILAGLTSAIAAYYPVRRATTVPVAELMTVE